MTNFLNVIPSTLVGQPSGTAVFLGFRLGIGCFIDPSSDDNDIAVKLTDHPSGSEVLLAPSIASLFQLDSGSHVNKGG